MGQVENNLEMVRFNGVTMTSVYLGGLNNLVNVTNQLKWNKVPANESETGEDEEYLTLGEIAGQLTEIVGASVVATVIENNPSQSYIYQYGNHNDGWYRLGKVCGYA